MVLAVKIGADTAKFTNVIIIRLRERWFGQRNWDDYRRWNQGSSWISGIEWAVVNFSELLLRPMSKNSVLEEFSVNRLAVIHEDICCRAFWRWVTDELSGGRKDRNSCVSSAYRWWFSERDEIRVLRGDVYIMKSRGPRTEPWGTPHKQAWVEEEEHMTY